jgi:serine protease Do
MTLAPLPHNRRRTLRAALLGAVAAITLSAVAIENGVLTSTFAVAADTQTSAGPASFADVVDRVKASVVSVKVKMDEAVDSDSDTQGMPQFPPGSPFERFFKQFGAPGQNGDGQDQGQGQAPHHPQHHLTMAQGSGFFISSDGYIVTNNHVVDHATEVTVTTADGKTLAAKVIGTDAKTDLALLKVKEAGDYPFVKFAPHTPRVGDWVIAVGNPFGLGGTVTAGIVSARGRDIGSGPYDDFLQIDAPVNHGNSGGPTFNTDGEVVGVNTAIFSPSGGSVGIGFAIASDVVQNVVDQLKDGGTVQRGWLGVEIQQVTQDIADSISLKTASGALVAKENKDAPAAAAGVKVGDVITAVNGQSVSDPRELARRIADLGPKKSAELTIWRDGAQKTVDVTLGTMPNDQQASLDAPAKPDAGQSLAKLGLTLQNSADGVTVSDVDPSGVAADHGLQPGDVILEASGQAVTRPAEVAKAFETAHTNGRKSVLLRVKSGEAVRFVALPTQAAS